MAVKISVVTVPEFSLSVVFGQFKANHEFWVLMNA